MSRILFTADWHFHKSGMYSIVTPVDGNSRLRRISTTIKHLSQIVKERAIDYVLFCGDMFETSYIIDREVLVEGYNGVKTILEENKKTSFVAIPGQHDLVERTGESILEASNFSSMTGSRYYVFPNLTVFPFDDFILGTVPFKRDTDRLKKQAEEFTESYMKSFMDFKPRPKILIGHLPLQDAMIDIDPNYMDKKYLSLSDFNPDLWDLMVFGDIHKPLDMTDKAFYVGPPLQHSHKEEGIECRYLVYDTETDELEEVKPIANPRFFTIGFKQWEALMGKDREFVRFNYLSIGAETSEQYHRVKQVMDDNNIKTYTLFMNNERRIVEPDGKSEYPAYTLYGLLEKLAKSSELSEREVALLKDMLEEAERGVSE